MSTRTIYLRVRSHLLSSTDTSSSSIPTLAIAHSQPHPNRPVHGKCRSPYVLQDACCLNAALPTFVSTPRCPSSCTDAEFLLSKIYIPDAHLCLPGTWGAFNDGIFLSGLEFVPCCSFRVPSWTTCTITFQLFRICNVLDSSQELDRLHFNVCTFCIVFILILPPRRWSHVPIVRFKVPSISKSSTSQVPLRITDMQRYALISSLLNILACQVACKAEQVTSMDVRTLPMHWRPLCLTDTAHTSNYHNLLSHLSPRQTPPQSPNNRRRLLLQLHVPKRHHPRRLNILTSNQVSRPRVRRRASMG